MVGSTSVLVVLLAWLSSLLTASDNFIPKGVWILFGQGDLDVSIMWRSFVMLEYTPTLFIFIIVAVVLVVAGR